MKFKENKIFFTGVSCSGKTTYAKEYSEEHNIPYIDFDSKWDYYGDHQQNYQILLNEYTDSFVTDAIPFAYTNGRLNFFDYYNKNKEDIQIICLCCSKDDLDIRVSSKPHLTKRRIYANYYLFYYKALKVYSKFDKIKYFNTSTNEFITKEELHEITKWILDYNKQFFDNLTYDKYYQDIECLEIKGYSQSYKTWDTIKDLVQWKDKKVADIGCFHCYFSIKVAQSGARVTALDINTEVLEAAKYINDLECSVVEEIKEWNEFDGISEDYDVTLCLNVLHHFKDIIGGLDRIKSKFAIFEVNRNLIEIIKEKFTILNQFDSHRIDSTSKTQRVILFCERIGNKKEMNVLTVVGIRPDFIRMSKIFTKLDEHFNHTLIHTGQHYDEILSNVFFDELKIRKPNYNLGIGGNGKEHFHQTSELTIKLIELIRSKNLNPDIICFLGDSNSVISSVALKKEGYNIVHIEAGMRSHDKRMLEEINRIVCDHCSDYLFVYHMNYLNNIVAEGLNINNIFVVGNTIVEVVKDYTDELFTKPKQLDHIVLDIHRPENFNYRNRLNNILIFANKCIDKYSIPVFMLDFGRTINKIKEYGLEIGKVQIVPLMSYKQYLQSAYDSKFVISDSGTAQEELALLNTPVIVPRDYTERPESVQNNCSYMIDVNDINYTWDNSFLYIDSKVKMNVKWLGDGTTSDKIVKVLTNIYVNKKF
jgi:UDP-N-acetylglucosamine 2-epimerase